MIVVGVVKSVVVMVDLVMMMMVVIVGYRIRVAGARASPQRLVVAQAVSLAGRAQVIGGRRPLASHLTWAVGRRVVTQVHVGGVDLMDGDRVGIDEVLARWEAELLLDRVQLGVQERVFARQLEHARLQQQVGDPALLARPLGGLVVLAPAVPVGVVLARVGDELALLPAAQDALVGAGDLLHLVVLLIDDL